MGGLDSIASIMQTFGTNYLDGSLVIMYASEARGVGVVLRSKPLFYTDSTGVASLLCVSVNYASKTSWY